MKTDYSLQAQKREETGNQLSSLREGGYVPGVVYGPTVENTLVKVNEPDFIKVFRDAGENTLISLHIDDDKNPRVVLIHDMALDPLKHTPLHVDFYQVPLDRMITSEVPLVFVGESPAVKEEDGTLIKTLHSIEVESLPTNIPQEIEVDISPLETFDDVITVASLRVEEGVEIKTGAEEVIASVTPPRSEEELEALEEEIIEDVEAVEGVAEEGEDLEEGEEAPEGEEQPADEGADMEEPAGEAEEE